jgi:hypothetical protein
MSKPDVVMINKEKIPLLTAQNKTGWFWTVETSPFIYDSSMNWPAISIDTPIIRDNLLKKVKKAKFEYGMFSKLYQD